MIELMIKAIIFDFDGVIVESNDIKAKAFAELFKNENKNAIRKIIGYHLNNTGVSRYKKIKFIYKHLLNRPLGRAEFSSLCNNFATLVLEKIIKAEFVKGAKEFLENYYSKYKFFLLSATPHKEIKEIIQRRQLSHFFKTIYGAPVEKSNAIREILKKESFKGSEALYVGDAMSDYLAAKASAVNFVARIYRNGFVFKNIDCLKIKDLTYLRIIVEML